MKNFLIINTDDLPASAFGRRWQPKIFDRLVDRGITFNNAFVPSANCGPSRASLLSGRYPHNHNVWITQTSAEDMRTLSVDRDTVATRLRGAGYQTMCVGKYNNNLERTYVPPGWSRFYPIVEPLQTETLIHVCKQGVYEGLNRAAEGSDTDWCAKEAEQFIEQKGALNQNWLCYVAPTAPHADYIPAPRNAGRFDAEPLYASRARTEKDMSDKPGWLLEDGSPTRQELLYDWRGKLNEMADVDDLVGRLCSTLARTGQWARTVVIFTSDNGYHLGEHAHIAKNTPYDEATKVPLVVAGGGIGRDVRNHLVSSTDIAATCLGLAGLPWGDLDGRSLASFLRGEVPIGWRRHAFGESALNYVYSWVRNFQHLYIEHEGKEAGFTELYDLSGDPELLHGLPAGPGTKPVRDALAGRLGLFKTATGPQLRQAEQ